MTPIPRIIAEIRLPLPHPAGSPVTMPSGNPAARAYERARIRAR
ncbi:hypothetical protein C7S14_6450 [Burkholderia cepacia]|nr:hypothetical protein C7S14_6450 [Burkholderia cepacia]